MKVDKIFAAALGVAVFSFVGCRPSDGLEDLAAGQAAYEARDLRKAERAFEKSAAVVSTNVETLVSLVRVKLDLGKLSEARAWHDRAVTLAGRDSDVRMLGAQLAWHAKDYAAAAKAFAALGADGSLDAETRAEAYNGLGVVEMACNNRDRARIAFLTACRLNRRSAAARYHLGLLYRDVYGYPEAALDQFNFYVRLDTQSSERVRKVLSVVIPALRETLARATAARPGVSRRNAAAGEAALAKAQAALKKGNYKTAKQNYQEALRADPLSYSAALGLADACLKTDASKNGKAQALEAYRQACMLRPSAVSTYLTAGNLALSIGRNASAVETFSRALAANPDSVEAIDGLIRALRATGSKDNAAVARDYAAYRETVKPTAKKKS